MKHDAILKASDCMLNERIPINWKNNNCEAMNHILKLNLDWKPAKIPDLVKMLEKEINLQESLTRGALYGTGNFELSHDALCYVHSMALVILNFLTMLYV